MDLGLLGDTAINAFVQLNPSAPWAIKVAESWRGLPFGKYLQKSPPRRRRSVTGPSSTARVPLWCGGSIVVNQDYPYEQAESLFFSKLPLDVRVIIYEMVLGGMLFHIDSERQDGRIFHSICASPETVGEVHHHPHEACDSLNLAAARNNMSPSRQETPEPSGFLPLPMTCRKAYTEAIEVLYNSNVFDFTSNNVAFRFLKTMIPTQRLRSIRHFRMTMRIPHHPAMNSRSRRDWNALFEFFGDQMSGLRNLYLKFLMLHPCQQQIRNTEDANGVHWIRPMVSMAADSKRKRGCTVEIMTGHELQNLGLAYEQAEQYITSGDYEEIVRLTCLTVHKRIRVSLGGQG
ncbi:hypothetical protein BAUCODRAFT_423004 [Baudoinia panamericana UAMH 10762]|uniref:DUF7730 domain-containing protein n=1 Tax=Baudoinia panamericana (strain UAMH 10762) TaxID=717646 RepID=M2LUT4_BAUPA|nr:uncharacterized protein BAUCODRAFT_423004 [Baudoinia panamericana UAMH 10762]EMC98372.1 hypothetical protein BAUCODRAFT_423004 [Baudoinia panamericana UAMH 10762]